MENPSLLIDGAAAPFASDFDAHRPRLLGLAYRMLGSHADAQDVVQDAWLRWNSSRPDELRSAEAWLVTTVTRLAIDRLRAAKTERQHYTGFWLPEPLLTDTHAPDGDYAPLAAHFNDRETAELTMAVALMNAWNRLSVGMRTPVRAAPLKVAA